MELMDPTLILQDDEKPKIQRFINIALLCSQHESKQRPSIAQVVAMLQNDTQSDIVVVCMSSNSGTLEPEEFDTMHLLALGGNSSQLTTVEEELEDESTLSINARSSRRALGQGGPAKGVLQLSEMHAK